MTSTGAFQRWALLVTVGFGLLLVTLDNSILYTALPTLTRELGATSTEHLWIINAYPLVMAGLLLGTGTLGDRIGHRRMFVIGLTIFGAASILGAFAPSPLVLIIARAILAVGAAAMMPATLALIRVTFTDIRERNVAIAVWGSLSVVGAALGPIAGGILLEFFWWGAVFLINVPFVIGALISTFFVAPRDTPDPSKKWDLLSSLQIMAGLAGLVFVIKEATKLPPNVPVLVGAAIVSGLGFWTFARRQRTLKDPLVTFAIFRHPAVLGGVLAAGFATFALGGIQLVTTQRFQLVEGFTPLESGLLVAVVALGSLPSGILGGTLLHRVGLLPLIAGGLAVSTGGIAIIATTFESSFGWLIAGLAIVGLGLGAAMSVASTAIVGNVAARRAGMASAVEEVSYEFGSLTAVALLGSLLTTIYTATVVLPQGVSRSARDSIDSALDIANRGGSNAELITAASSAFDTGYLIVMIVIAVIVGLGALATAFLLRSYGPGTEASSNPHH